VPNLDAAGRLFAEQGARSGRRFTEPTGPCGTTLTSRQFGTTVDLVRAITHQFTADVERARAGLIAELDEAAGLRDWLRCLVFPWTDHFDRQGTPYFSRMCAQALPDPRLRAVVTEEALASPTFQHTWSALKHCLPPMPATIAGQRAEIAQQVIVRMCAERETALATGTPTMWSSWRGLSNGLVDALASIWTAPCTTGQGGQRCDIG
jgi:hypothetical protein